MHQRGSTDYVNGTTKISSKRANILTKITVQTYAPVARGIPMAVAPSGRERSWFTLIPISNRASASHYNKIKDKTIKIYKYNNIQNPTKNLY